MNRGPGRPPHPDVLTPAEWRVLEQLRAGKPNAEIAVRLGISVNTVKYHVSNILGKLGVADREAAAAWDGAPRRARMLAPVVWGLGRLGVVGGGVAGAAAVGGVIVVMALIGGGGGGSDGGGASVVGTAEATVVALGSTTRVFPLGEGGLPFEQHAEYREYGAAELEAAGFVDTGRFLRVPANPFPVAESSYRAGFTAVRVAEDGFISVGGAGDDWSRGASPSGSTMTAVGLAGGVAGQWLNLSVSGEWGALDIEPDPYFDPESTRVMWVGTDGIAFYSVRGDANDPRPQLIIDVGDAKGRSYPVIIDTSGHLWVRAAPLVDGPTVDVTGERLGVTEATLGPLPAWAGAELPILNGCPPDGGCFVVLSGSIGLRAPVSGEVSCSEGDLGLGFVLETHRYRIRFAPLPPLSVTEPVVCEGEGPRPVEFREELSMHTRWVVTATDIEGNVAHVVAGDDWSYWVGVEARAITECPPCLGPG